jgi:hypothetical protein
MKFDVELMTKRGSHNFPLTAETKLAALNTIRNMLERGSVVYTGDIHKYTVVIPSTAINHITIGEGYDFTN